MQVGPGEIIMLVIILVIVFSASQMSSLGNAIGRFVYSFRKASQGEGFVDVKPSNKLERSLDRSPDRGGPDRRGSEKGTEDAQIIDGAPKR